MSIRADAVPEHLLTTVSGPDARGSFGNRVSSTINSRGVTVTVFDDDFSGYPTSNDPVFDRFQINMAGRVNPSGEIWNFSQFWYIPTLFVEGQIDADDPSLFDPLPRWQGVSLTENQGLGILTADINIPGGDGVVDTADLGVLISDFGTSNPRSDINIPGGDGVVDTADLGVLISEFGQGIAPFCVYVVDKVNAGDPDGFLLDPTTIANAPEVGETIAIFNSGSSANDADLDGCPDCDFFNILVDGAVSGERLYGDWTLQDSALADLSGIEFRADVDAISCDGWGSETVFADARGESTVSGENFNLGARSLVPLMTPTSTQPIIMDCDFFLTSYETFIWFDVTSSVESRTAARLFMGGYAPAITSSWLPFSSRGDGLINHFVFLGTFPNNCCFLPTLFGTIPNDAIPEYSGVPNIGKEILLNEWFTLRIRMTSSDLSIWLRDSETITLADPLPGDSGDGTFFDGSDDIEEGFAKVFPFGPYGVTSTNSGAGATRPEIPHSLITYSMDTFRWVYGGDPSLGGGPPGYAPRTVFYDNLHVEGVLFPFPDLPKFALNYLDDIEMYFADTGLRMQGDRWFDAMTSDAVIDDSSSVSGSQSIRQSNHNFDGRYRLEFETDLPVASAETATWTAGVSISTSNDTVVRAVRLHDDTLSHDPSQSTVAHMLTGSENDEGNTSINELFFSTFHMRVANPNFDPSIEPFTQRGTDRDPPAVPTNSPFINVPTNTFWNDQNIYHHFTFEVDSDRNLIVRRDGALILPDPVGAIAAGYTDGMGGLYKNGWEAGSTSVTRMSFESGNQPLAPNVTMNVDDVFLDGFAPVYSPGPVFELPYADGFEDYAVNTPVDGQGETPFVDAATLVDESLCIGQGAQALNAIATGPGDWCEYEIKSDSIGGIDPVNDWGLSDGDLIWVRQADCNGAVACKDLQCFTNPNRPDEFFPNVGLFDPSDTFAPVGARVEFVALRTAFDPPALGIVDTFEWDTYGPTNVFGRYLIDSINDASDSPGQQNIETPRRVNGDPTRNVPYYNTIGGKVIVGNTIAVDPAFDEDPDTGVTPSPGLPGESAEFKIVDPCGELILSGMWTLIGDGVGGDDATALECTDIPHFNYAFRITARYVAEVNGQSTVIDDPTGSGRGHVLRQANNDGFELGGGLFVSVDSTFPEAFAIVGTDSVLEFDCFVTDNNSRLAIEVKGSKGSIMSIQLGGPDNNPLNSPGDSAVPSANFSIFENNPDMGPFAGSPVWFYDTGVAVPLNSWFRIRVAVGDGGMYTVAMDQSGIPGGDGVFETSISTASAGSMASGMPIDADADAISGFDTVVGNDSGGDGVFNRDPIEVIENSLLPGAWGVPNDFCYYRLESVDGETLGTLPAPCDGVFRLGDTIAIRRNAALPNWPNGGVVEHCPISPRFIWNDDLLTGQCEGEWTLIDTDSGLSPFVHAWAEYVAIPPYIQPPPASMWYFDNITLDGSPTQ